MARRPPVNPRKQASQKRSRATVDALIEATARILVKEGFDKASTNRIAEVAGVSVGSLYQYFPCKEALVAAVMERHQRQIMAVARSALAKAATSSLQQAVRAIVAAAIEAHRVDPKLHRVLAEQTPRVGRLDEIEAMRREGTALFRSYLEAHRGELAVSDLDLAAFVSVTIVEALTHTAVLYHPEMLGADKAGLFIDEVTRLVLRYLKGANASAAILGTIARQ